MDFPPVGPIRINSDCNWCPHPAGKLAQKVATFILFSAAIGATIWAFTRLFDLNCNFSSQIRGLSFGLAISFSLASAYAMRRIKEDNTRKIAIALAIIAAIGLTAGCGASGILADEWRGLLSGLILGAASAALCREYSRWKQALSDYIPPSEKNPGSAKEHATKIALFALVTIVTLAVLLSIARLYGAQLNLGPHWKGLFVGGTLALFGAGAMHLAKHAYEHRSIDCLSENEARCFYLAIALIAIVVFIALDKTETFTLQEAFSSWKDALAGILLASSSLLLMRLLRDRTLKENALRTPSSGPDTPNHPNQRPYAPSQPSSARRHTSVLSPPNSARRQTSDGSIPLLSPQIPAGLSLRASSLLSPPNSARRQTSDGSIPLPSPRIPAGSSFDDDDSD